MRVLVITNNPERASFRQRIEVYFELLAESGINCELAKYPSSLAARWKLLRRTGEYDAVFLHKRRFNPLDRLMVKGCPKKLIYDFDDAIMYDDQFPEKLSIKRQNDFKRTIKLADTVIAGNSFLAEHAKEFNSNVKVLPTGLDLKPYDVSVDRDDDKVRLVWIGSKSTLPYLAGIKPALERIGERFDNVVLCIICDDFFDMINMRVEKYQWSLETQSASLVGSDIGLAPLPDNRFTRGKCGFKILQYASAGLATVASPVGVNAEYVIEGKTGFHASEMDQWVQSLETLINDVQLRKSMGENAKALALDFDIPAIGKRLCAIIKETL